MAVNYLTSVPKLLGRENYTEWCFAVENVFVLEGLNKCIDGTEEDTVMLNKAKAKLILTLDPTLFVHIRNKESCKDVWDTLKKMYEDNGFTRKIGLLRTLISLRYEDCSSMETYVTKVIENSRKLDRTGFRISEEWIGSLLLAGLPDRFAPMIMAIEHSGIVVTADEIKTKLLDMETESDARNTTIAFANRGRFRRKPGDGSTSNSRDKKDRMDIICYKCKQTGHYQNKCPSNLQQNKKKTQTNTNAFSVVFLNGIFDKGDWYMDSAASNHITSRGDWLKNVAKTAVDKITVANNEKLSVKCSGQVNISTLVDKQSFDIVVNDVLYVPGLSTNLLSVGQLTRRGNRVLFSGKDCAIYNSADELIATATMENNMYKLNVNKPKEHFAGAAAAVDVWHRRLGHMNYKDLSLMQNVVDGLDFKGKPDINRKTCQTCCEGKQCRLPFKHVGTRATQALEVIHADLCGPMEVTSMGGSKYYLVLEDDFSRMAFVYFLKRKDQALDYFKEFKALVENQKNTKIKCFRSDNGGEFCSSMFESFLSKNGIIHQKTNPYTPQQNGMSERMNRTLVEKARCLLFDAGLDKIFWAEAINTAVYLRNRSIVAGLKKTPFEIWSRKQPDVSNLRIFGSEVMMLIPTEKRRKFDKKSKKMILIGFCENVKGYRLYDPITKIIVTSRDVIINEKLSNGSEVFDLILNEDNYNEVPASVGDIDQSDILESSVEQNEASSVSSDEYAPQEDSDGSSSYPDVVEDSTEEQKTVRRTSRQPRPKTFEDYTMYACEADVKMEDIPSSVSDALSRDDSDKWRQAIEDELASFEENEAWEVVKKPENATIVQCKWVFKKKFDSSGKVRYKARLVAKGFTQRPGVDYEETFSPVVRHSTLRLLIALSVNLELRTTHLDVTTAFLNGSLTETVFMMQPEGLNNSANNNYVLRLKRAIYGLKQASRVWYEKVENVLKVLGYKKSKYEPCVYMKYEGNFKTIVALYVDDFFIFSNSDAETNFLKKELSLKFKIKDLGQLRQCLGMRVNIDKDKGSISLDQEQYIDELLLRFNMSDCKTVNTPMENNLKLIKCEIKNDSNFPYQQLIGALMYLAVLTRPDISFCVSYLSQFNNCFSEEHWKCAKRVLRYLKGTKKCGLTFVKSDIPELEGFVDADWAGDMVDRRSYTGFCFKFSGSVVSWESRKQGSVALSSTEAEYVALSEAAREAIYLRNLFDEFIGNAMCITLFNDNQSAQKLCNNPAFHKRAKHIDIRHHFVREAVSNNFVNVKYLRTDDMPADILTKSLSFVKHNKFSIELGITNVLCNAQ